MRYRVFGCTALAAPVRSLLLRRRELHNVCRTGGAGDYLPKPFAPGVEGQRVIQAEVQPAVSAEMWLYLNEQKRYDDARLAVRRKAEFRAQQRSRRLAAQKWFGFSNQRPQANVTPFTSIYSPRWTGNGVNEYDWRGVNHRHTVIIEHPVLRR